MTANGCGFVSVPILTTKLNYKDEEKYNQKSCYEAEK
jgi:hypothetical protein